MQRLVVLFEASAQNGGGFGVGSGSSSGQGKQNQPPSQPPPRQPPPNQPNNSSKTPDPKPFIELVNDLFDGSKQMLPHTRQFFSNMSQVFSTVASQATRLDSAAKRAAAAYKGQYTAMQAVNETVNFAASSIRNVTQYGLAVGGLMSAWDGFTRLVQHEQQKLEAAVKIAAAHEAAERGRALTRFVANNPNLSSPEIALKKLEDKEKELNDKAQEHAALIEKREAILRARAEEAQKRVIDPFLSTTGFSTKTEHDARIKHLATDLETENSEEQKRNRNEERLNAIEDLKKLETQRAQSAEIASINNKLQIKLQKIYLEGERTNYEKISRQIEYAKEAAEATLSLGSNVEHFESLKQIIELQVASQRNAIAKATEKHNEEIYKASQELSFDNEGNINKQETVKKVKDLTEKFRETISKLAIKITGLTYEDVEDSNLVDSQGNKVKVRKFFYKGQQVKITAEQAKALEEAAAAANQSVADKATDLQNQLIDLGQQIETAKGEDAIKDVKQRLRDAVMEITDETKLAQPEILGLYVDPTSQVANKKREIERIISKHKEELKGAITDAERQYITAELAKYELALKAIAADEKLQKRALAGIKYDQAADALGIEMSDSQAVQSLKHQQQSADLENAAKLMRERRGNVGETEAQKRRFELQRAQFAEAQKLRQEEIDRQKKLLAIAKKEGADQEKIVQIKKKIFDLNVQQKQALAAQASELIRQNASVLYQLKDDKPTFDRSRIVQRIGSEPTSERLSSTGRLGPKLKGIGLYDGRDVGQNFGSEHARLTSDFEEDWRKRYGKLTKEEKAQAKQERKLNNRLQHAIEAVNRGGGTSKQRELVAYYKEHAGKEKASIEDIVKNGFDRANKALYKMADMKEPSSDKTSK
jgi:hypothetical protein